MAFIKLRPEKNEVMEKHDDIVGQLNERMALKARYIPSSFFIKNLIYSISSDA